MSMQTDTSFTDSRDDAIVAPTECHWCLAVAAVILVAVTALFFL